MCESKNFLHALDKEVELLHNGFQTCVFGAEFLGKDNFGLKYKMTESNRTNAKFEDIQNSFARMAKKGGDFELYQVPENKVPRVQLLNKNRVTVNRLLEENDKKTKKRVIYFWLKTHINSDHILCIPPSTLQIVAEISAMEHVCGNRGDLNEVTRLDVNAFEDLHMVPQNIPPFLSALWKKEEMNLPDFKVKKLTDKEYVVLKDKKRPGNDQQRLFVCTALSSPDITIKVGPPGSGKTTALFELIIQLVQRKKRILLVASTNVAVDNILEKLKDYLDLACVKRYGSEDNSNVSIVAKNFIVGKQFAKTEAEALQNRLNAIPVENRSHAQQELLDNCDVKNNGLLYEILMANTPIVAGTTFGASREEMKLLMNKGETEPPFDYLILDEASKTTIQEFLVPACLCKHWVIVGDIQQLPPYVSDSDLAENLKICYPEDSGLAREYTVASDTLLAASGKGLRQTVILVEKESEMDAYLYRKYAKNNDVLFADADSSKDDKLLPFATIIVGSIDSFKKKRDLLSPRITTVRLAHDAETGRILHEEGMHEWVAMARYNREKLFERFDENEPREWQDEIGWRLTRKFEQRDNIVNADRSSSDRLECEINKLIPGGDQEACKKKIHILEQIYLPSCMELFCRGYGKYKDLALFRGIPEKMLATRCIKLSYQHRSHPEIAQFASEEFYDGEAMRSEHMKGKREWEYSRYGSRHVKWLDVEGNCDHKNRNKKEQECIRKELTAFRNFAKLHPNKSQKWSVAVLSFYKEQAEDLKRICQEVFRGCSQWVTFSAGSVDSFQGHEADLVFLSYSNRHPTCFLEAPNRLNVAITRARYMMVHVGDRSAMSKGQGALGRLVQKITNLENL